MGGSKCHVLASAECCKADKCQGNIHITQDVIMATQVLPSHPCALSFAIQATLYVNVCKTTLDECFFCEKKMYQPLSAWTSDSIASLTNRLCTLH